MRKRFRIETSAVSTLVLFLLLAGMAGCGGSGDAGCKLRCQDRQCGDDGCGGTCGSCEEGLSCSEQGICTAEGRCTPDCSGRICGTDGCGGSCGVCPAATPICSAEGLCHERCVPLCEGFACGQDDGCGGICETCDEERECTEGTCEKGACQVTILVGYCLIDAKCVGEGDARPGNPCQYCLREASLSDWTFGADGTVCGEAAGFCYQGLCCDPVANCLDKECGDDGCGGSCGPCVTTHPYEGMEPVGVTVGSLLGIASHLPRELEPSFKRDFELDKLQEAGVTRLRKTFRWEHMEPADDDYWFDEYNLVIDECAAHGIEVMVGFRGKPQWATSTGDHDGLDAGKWKEFLGVFVDEVKDRVRLIEIWNEPNLDVFWDPKPNPAKYAELVVAAHEAIHQHHEDAVVLLGGLSPFQFNSLGVWGFLLEAFEARPDLCNYFDALSLHPYTFLQMLPPEQGATMLGVYQPGVVGMIEEARSILADKGCPDKPIHLTEAGWPDLYIGLDAQASYLARSIPLVLKAGAKSWYWYTFWDGDLTPTTPIPSEERFGLFTWPNDETTQHKPVYEVLSALGNELAGFRYAGDLGEALDPPLAGIHAHVLRDDDGNWIVGLWRDVDDSALDEPVAHPIPLHPDAQGDWELLDQHFELLDSGSTEHDDVVVDLTGRVTWLRFFVPFLDTRSTP